ncbi:MAG: D-amino-acid transaminase [Hyphomicrobiales bacterium]|jgi:D-alanine transaminase|nr:D-amino-acid transaminase [Hyphomicrobiales bacterium]
MSRIVYVNGAYLPEEKATISIFDRGFLFADGIYEVSAVINGKLVDVEAHMERLERSCAEIRLALPWSRAEIIGIHHELMKRNALISGGIYLQVTRGAADRSFTFPGEAKASLVMFTQARPMNREVARGYKLLSLPDLRWKRRDIKSVGLLAQVLAKQAAAEAGCDEALMIEDGVITEGGSSTAWIVKGKTLISRPLSNAVLPGITRKAMLTYLAESGFAFEERPFTLQEALEADEVIISAATALVMPVTEIDGQSIGGGQPGPVARRLRDIYFDLAETGGALG